MIINDGNKTRNVESVERKTYSNEDIVNNIQNFEERDYAEMIVIGNNGNKWKHWIPIEQFNKENPEHAL